MHLVWRHMVTMWWNTSHVCNINQGDGTKIRTHIWLIPKPNIHCVWHWHSLSDTWHYWWEEERTHIGPVLPSMFFLSFLLTIPTPCPLPSLSLIFSSPSPISSFPSFTFCFSHSLVSFPLVLHVPKPILCTGHVKVDEIHTPSLKISPFAWSA